MGGDKPVKFQSTLPRRERLPFSATVPILIRISIHAPAKGATSSILSTRPSMTISIHAPAKGATRFRNFLKEKCIFQSTLPRRERRTFEICIQISFNNFNPRSREGSDMPYRQNPYTRRKFQSTLPRRERLRWKIIHL